MAVGVLVVTVCMLVSRGHAWGCNTSLQELYPQWDPSPYSCEGRCGESNKTHPCACDWRCGLYGDCCEDVTGVCGDISNHMSDDLQLLTSTPDNLDNKSSQLLQQMPESLSDFLMPHSLRKSQRLSPQPHSGSVSTSSSQSASKISRCVGKARLISVCSTPVSLPEHPVLYGGRQIDGKDFLRKCHTSWDQMSPPDFLQLLPVSDKVTGNHFLNIYCFLCHGGHVSQSVPWTLSLAWGEDRNLNDSPRDVLELMEKAGKNKVPAVVFPPANVTVRRCGFQSEKLNALSCHCSDLMDTCANGTEAYIVANYQLYRHPTCLQCAFIRVRRRPDLIQVPDLDRWTWAFRSLFYPVNLTWSSDPANNANVSMTISYDPKPSGNLFAWERMECELSVDSVDENQDIDLRDPGNEHTPNADDHNGNVDDNESNTTSEKSEHGRDSKLYCQQTRCAVGSVEVDGVCTFDLQFLFISVRMSCMKQVKSDAIPPLSLSLGPKTKLVQSSEFTQKQLTEDLQQRLHAFMDKVVVSNPTVCWDENHCYWEISAEAGFPKGRLDRKNMKNEHLASTMYSVTTHILSQQLTNVKHGLLVCVRVESMSADNRPADSDGPCAYSTVLWPVRMENSAFMGKAIDCQGRMLLSFVMLGCWAAVWVALPGF